MHWEDIFLLIHGKCNTYGDRLLSKAAEPFGDFAQAQLAQHLFLNQAWKEDGLVQTKKFVLREAVVFVEFYEGLAQRRHTWILAVKIGRLGHFS